MAMYQCSNCGATMSQPLDRCPNCRVLLSGVKCQACGYLGGKTEFTNNNNHCPKCGSVVYISSTGLSKTPLNGLGWAIFAFLLSLLVPGFLLPIYTKSPVFYSSSDYTFPLLVFFLGSLFPIGSCISVVQRGTYKPARILGWAGILINIVFMFFIVGVALTKGSTPFHISVKVPTTYIPLIDVPECNEALMAAKFSNNPVDDDNNFLCIASDVGDPIGMGKVWNNKFSYMDMESEINQINIFMNIESWTLVFNPPSGEPYRAGFFENAVIGYDDPLHPRLNIKFNKNQCEAITGNFEILELEYVEGKYSSGMKHFSANFEQHCNGNEAALRGYIRYKPTIKP